ncbi:MAG: hypothetical protein K9J13_08630 [Saprospiraceae bacterium]|nr:hypothetical protein [Saprospiraceae bacterium]
MKNASLKIVLALIVATAFNSGCITTKLPDTFEVTPKVLETHGGKISVSVKGTIPAKSFHKKAIVEITPVLKYGGTSVALKSITLKGEKAEGDGKVINSKTGGEVTYSDVIDYKPEMNVAELFVTAKGTKGKKPITFNEFKIADGVIYTSTRVGKGEKTKIAEHGYEKVTLFSKGGDIYFAYNKSVLNLSLELNKKNSPKLDELTEFLRKGWAIKNISVNAWASPEGEESLNQELSDERAKAAKDYLVSLFKKLISERNSVLKMKKPSEEIQFDLVAKGEDFNGFMKALDASQISDKNTISNVINSQATKSQREQQIKNMTVIYSEIEEMLSVLRRAEINVTCFEPKRSDDNIAMLSTTYPDSLNVKEILYAAILSKDLNTQLKIYNSITKIYPQEWKGYNNAAATNLRLGNVDEAAKLLDKANSLKPNNGVIANNLGVIAAWNKDYEAAKTYYETAQGQGVDVTYNLGVLMILDGNYEGAISSLGGGKDCDYNLALATLMNNNPSDAAKILDCAPKTAEVYYLLAIVGARTGNTALMIENLKKACAEVPAYKVQAKDDREFLKYFDNSDFKDAIK